VKSRNSTIPQLAGNSAGCQKYIRAGCQLPLPDTRRAPSTSIRLLWDRFSILFFCFEINAKNYAYTVCIDICLYENTCFCGENENLTDSEGDTGVIVCQLTETLLTVWLAATPLAGCQIGQSPLVCDRDVCVCVSLCVCFCVCVSTWKTGKNRFVGVLV